MLPGDYIAYRMTGEVGTSMTGLSEGIMWDFHSGRPSFELLKTFQVPTEILAEYDRSFSVMGYLTGEGAAALGIDGGRKVAVSYRSGDQPNNAWSLGVNEAGKIGRASCRERVEVECVRVSGKTYSVGQGG